MSRTLLLKAPDLAQTKSAKNKKITMARALNLSFKDTQFSFNINKIDRAKLYGYTSVDVKDDNGSSCSLATISEDGKHILSKGCVGYTTLNERNEYMAAADIQMKDKDGNALERKPSSFDFDDIPLEVSSIEEYLTINVKSVYQLGEEEDEHITAIYPFLEEHKVLKFAFNYRADYDSDDAFVIHNDGGVFMVLGSVSPFEFIGLDQKMETAVIEEEDEDDDDDFDFGAL